MSKKLRDPLSHMRTHPGVLYAAENPLQTGFDGAVILNFPVSTRRAEEEQNFCYV